MTNNPTDYTTPTTEQWGTVNKTPDTTPGNTIATPTTASQVMPMTMYGTDPVTGLPFSDKSKTVAVLLTFFLGGLGVGRFYKGDKGLGIAMLLLSWLTLGLWPLIDCFVLGLGSPKDKYGRPLR